MFTHFVQVVQHTVTSPGENEEISDRNELSSITQMCE